MLYRLLFVFIVALALAYVGFAALIVGLSYVA